MFHSNRRPAQPLQRAKSNRRRSMITRAIEPLEPRRMLSVTVGTTFGGLDNSYTGWGPLDPNAAVGPNHIVQVINTNLAIFTKSGQLIMQKPFGSLVPWTSSDSYGSIDPYVVYDPLAQRFVFTAGLTGVYFAVSNSSDPTQGWGEFHTVDMPAAWDGGRFGYNADAYVLTWPGTNDTVAIDKSSVLDQNNATFVTYRTNRPGGAPFLQEDAVPGDPIWLNNGSSMIKMTNVLSTTPTYTSYALSGNSVTGSKTAEMRNNKVILCDEFGILDWNVLDMTTVNDTNHTITVTQSGTITPPDGFTAFYSFSSIAPNGDIGINYIAYKGTQLRMYVTGRAPGDAAGTMQTSVMVGSGTYNSPNRIGDYSSIFVDPSNNTFWAMNNPDNASSYTIEANFGISATPAAALAPVYGFGALPPTSNQVALTWNAVAGATGYSILRSTDNITFTNVASLGSGATSYTDTTTTAGTAYYYNIVASNASMTSAAPEPIQVVTGGSLPVGWLDQDIGAVSLYGGANYNAGTYTVIGAGSDVWNTADNGPNFAYEMLTGNGSITARVASQTNTNGFAKAGVMIRESLAAGSKHAFMSVTPSNGTAFQYRSATGGASTNSNTVGFVAPYWVRLVRSGTTISGYRSADGITWTLQSSATISMNSTVYIGLANCATNGSARNTSTFDNVAFTGTISAATGPSYNALAAPTGVSAALAATGTGVVLTWTTASGNVGYQIERAGNGSAWTTIGTAATGATTYTDSSPAGSYLWSYRIRTLDASSGVSVASSNVSIANRPNSPTVTVTKWGTTQLQLKWNKIPSATSFSVYRSTDGVNYTLIGTSPENYYTYTDAPLPEGTAYWYSVIANSTVGSSAAGTIQTSTNLPAITNFVFTSITSSAVAMSWTAVVGADSYLVERSTNGTTFSTLGTVTTTTYNDATVSPMVTYYYRLTAKNSVNGASSATSTIFCATPSNVALPTPWASADIGSPNSGGSSYNTTSKVWTMLSQGTDIGSTSDQFRYNYVSLTGDGWIVARVSSQQNSGNLAKAGVMIRESLAANSANAFTGISYTQGGDFQYRTTTGGTTTATIVTIPKKGNLPTKLVYEGALEDTPTGFNPGEITLPNGLIYPNNNLPASVAAPFYVKLVRTGNTFVSQISQNGTAWTTIGTEYIPMASTVYMGLAADSNSTTLMNSSTFDKVMAAQGGTVLTVNPATPGTVSVTPFAPGSPLTITAITQGAKGTVVNNGDGTVTYTPNPTATGQDSFTYTATDTLGNVTTIQCPVVINGLQASLAFNEGTGTTSADGTGDLYDATLVGTTWGTDVKGTGALNFAGTSSSYATIPALELYGNNATFGGWVYRNGTQSAWSGLVFCRGSNANGFHFGTANELRYTWNNSATTYNYSSGLVVPNQTWTYVALVISPTNAKFYMKPLGSAMTTATQTTALAAAPFDNTTYLGQDPNGNVRYFNGMMDDWKIYNTSLTATDIAGLANLAPTVATAASATPAPVTGTITSVSALAGDLDGESTVKYTWSAIGTPPAPVSFTANGTNAAKNATAMFIKAGTYTLQCNMSDSFVSTNSITTVTVNSVLTSLEVTPNNVSVQAGQTQQFSVIAYDQFGEVMATPAITWSLGGGSVGSVNSSGLYTAGATGLANVIATSGSISGTSSLSVGSAAPTVATPASVATSTVTGKTVAVTVLGADDAGEAALTYAWSVVAGPSSVAFSPNATNAAKSATATFNAAGAYVLAVTIRDANGNTVTSNVSVTVAQTATAIKLTPASVSLGTTSTKQFAVTATDQFGAAIASPSVAWSITSGGGSINASGLFTAPATAGKSTVRATVGSLTATSAVSTFAWSPYNLTVRQTSINTLSTTFRDSTTLETGFQIQAGLKESNGTITWTTVYTTSAQPGSGGTVTYNFPQSFAPGTWCIRARATNASGSSNWSNVATTVISAASAGLLNAPLIATNLPTLYAGQQVQLRASLNDPTLVWDIITGPGTITEDGLFIAGSTPGTTIIRARFGEMEIGESEEAEAREGEIEITTIAWSPTNLVATKVGTNRINVSFNDQSNVETGFHVQVGQKRADGTIAWSTIYTAPANTGPSTALSYAIPTTFKAGTYFVRARATNALGDSPWSSVSSVQI